MSSDSNFSPNKFRFPGAEPKYRWNNGVLKKIIRKKGPNGWEEHLEEIEKPDFKAGWVIIRGVTYDHGIFHYFEKDKTEALCKTPNQIFELISDDIKKRIYVDDPKNPGRERYRPCKHCMRRLEAWENTGIHPSEMFDHEPDEIKKRPNPNYDDIKYHKPSQSGTWQTVICPGCKQEKQFFNGKKKQEHYCDTCLNVVILPEAAIR